MYEELILCLLGCFNNKFPHQNWAIPFLGDNHGTNMDNHRHSMTLNDSDDIAKRICWTNFNLTCINEGELEKVIDSLKN